LRTREAVLRITIFETPSEQKWVLQGRLIGPWAAELRATWKRGHRKGNGRRCIVDLREVTFIDASGEKVLTKMMQDDAQFIVEGVYSTHVIETLCRKERKSCKLH
jgi:anti-anti-sigma regulatory factor